MSYTIVDKLQKRQQEFQAWTSSEEFRNERKRKLWLAGGFSIAAIYFTHTAFHDPMFTLGILYVAAFSLVAWKRPAIALMLVFASAPFQNDLSGGDSAKFSIAEVNLVLTIPIFYIRSLIQRKRIRGGPIILPVLCYFAVCIFSSCMNWLGGTALISLFQMFLYFIVVVIIFCNFAPSPKDYWPALYVIVLVGSFLSVAGLATDYWFIGLNKNGIAASLACSFLVAVELIISSQNRMHRIWLTLGLLIISVGLLFSLGRGAWLGSLAGVVYIYALRRQLPRLGKIALTVAPFLILFWFLLPAKSQDYAAGFSGDHYNIQLRYQSIALAQSYFEKSPVYGMGVGLRKEYDATNLILMTLAETGILGLIALIGIHIAFFRMVYVAQKRISPSDPIFSLLCIAGALVLDKFVHGLVDHYWSRGAIMMAWSAAGMATRVYYIALSRPVPVLAASPAVPLVGQSA